MRAIRDRGRRGGDPPEWLVYDRPTRCPYLTGQTARFPLRLPLGPLDGKQLARRLEAGDRRQGLLLYQPTCPTCRACEALRIDVGAFEPGKTQRRVFRRGEVCLETTIGRPTLTQDRVTLYNRHKAERRLLVGDGLIDAAGYEEFLVESCTDTIEIAYYQRGQLVGVAIADRAADALSAVYAFFDPDYSRLSPGTYSILKQIALCRSWGLRYLYLGLYIGPSRHMSYKANYLPHERLIGGEWRRFERSQRACR